VTRLSRVRFKLDRLAYFSWVLFIVLVGSNTWVSLLL
jgi:hypothetical protein